MEAIGIRINVLMGLMNLTIGQVYTAVRRGDVDLPTAGGWTENDSWCSDRCMCSRLFLCASVQERKMQSGHSRIAFYG